MKVTPHPCEELPNRTNYELTAEEVAAGFSHVVITGPISGTISLADGSAYDVTPYHIAIKPEHADELHLAIHKAHHAAGRFLDSPLPSE